MLRQLRLLLLFVPLTGCALVAPPQDDCVVAPVAPVTVDRAESPALQLWLDMEASVAKLTAEEAQVILQEMSSPGSDLDTRYYYALLNQHRQSVNGWIQARDMFRLLSQDSALEQGNRQLALLLESYNQKRINWNHKYKALDEDYNYLKEQLRESEQDKLVLEQKIEALTEVEAVISTLKEQ